MKTGSGRTAATEQIGTAEDEPVGDLVEIADLLLRVHRRIHRGSHAELDAMGLTGSEARALRAVERAGGPVRMADLAAGLEVVPRSVTTMVDGLEAAGLVARETDPRDRRSQLVTLTGAGRTALGRLELARRRTTEEVLSPLTGGQRASMLAALRTVCECGPRVPWA